MKKSTFLAISAVILAFFIVSAFGNSEKLYEKKENFERPEEAIVNFIGYVNSYETVKEKNSYYEILPREFLESISKRYRLYTGTFMLYRSILGQVPALYSYEIHEIDYNSLTYLKESYEDSFKHIANYKRDENPRVYRLDGFGVYDSHIDKSSINEDGTVNNIDGTVGEPLSVYLIVIDEGEGFVVDYYSVSYQ
ncbi:MAG: hypothetical protein HUJ77_02565 [Clostridium sp.]|uniref:hypothetical protein n=1 Tax=Clostridium sp. TaxID=1506 RepID=UPI0025C279EF|nr:hypothetical protein [Clostridium sp.]MCF0147261.1 hypothetical protein [Clostridium sp.]